jgi:dihydrodipicolinate synthase/N-acetylneuraminate lyase
MMDKIIMLYNNPQIKRTPIEDELVLEYVKTR